MLTLFTYRPSRLAAIFYISVILFSALLLLIPGLRSIAILKKIFDVLGMGFLPFWIHRIRHQKDLKMKIPQIAKASNKGAKLELPGLEMAAFIGWFLSAVTNW